MKKTSIFITALALTALTLVTSCQKEGQLFRFTAGEEIRFAVGSAGGAATKTAYSGKGTATLERIDWEVNDRIRIYCGAVSEPAGTKWADYTVTSVDNPSSETSTDSYAYIEGTGGIGLRWGTGDHTFYAVTPSTVIGENDSKVTASANVSASQVPVLELTEEEENAAAVTIAAGGTRTLGADMRNMFMVAKSGPYTEETGIPEGEEVFLAFTPLTTAVQFTITNGTDAAMTLTSVSLISGNGKSTAEPVINGGFSINLDSWAEPEPAMSSDESMTVSYGREYPACTCTGDATSAVMSARTVTIDFGKDITLAAKDGDTKGGSLTFTFLLTPTHDFEDLTFKLTKSDKSWMSTRLGYTDGSGIFFPHFKKTKVEGLFIPEGAQWTVKYGPDVEPWNDDSETIYPAPELKPITEVTPWEEGVEDLPLFKYDYSFNATGTFHYDYSGGSSSLNITSRKTLKRFIGDESRTEVIAVPWHLEYWDEADEQWATPTAESRIAEFVTFDKVSGSGNISADESIDMTVDVADNVKTTHNARLRATSLGSESKPYDLSMHDILGNERKAGPVTANCYVIRAKGWYCLPLVYGNAIDYEKAPVSGNYSPAYSLSYLVDDDQTHILHNFSNYTTDDYITTPFIEHDIKSASKTPSAALLWSYSYSGSSDAPISSNIITDVQIVKSGSSAAEGLPLGTSCSYIKFQVTDDITQSNSVIAVKDGDNKIMWSWHIWITDEDMSTQTAGSVQMLPVNLGWAAYDCTSDISTYPGKSLKIRIVQDDANNNAKEFTIERKEYIPGPTGSGDGTNTFYQWGRKDPFIVNKPKAGTGDHTGSFSSLTEFSSQGGAILLSNSIQNPAKFAGTTTYQWISPLYYNLWSGSNRTVGTAAVGYSTVPVKTIYDPCPPGFQVPQTSVLNDMAPSLFTKGAIFPASTNYEDTDKKYYWTAAPQSDTSPYAYEGNKIINDANYARAFCVRPVHE